MKREELVEALQEAGVKHHEYEQQFLGEFDKGWIGFYTAYILGKFPDLGRPSEIATCLKKAQESHDDESVEWPEFYADYLLENV